MSGLRQQLQAQLARFDEEGFAALANRGLLRRAHKDLERLSVEVIEEGAEVLLVAVGPQRVRFDARGPAQAVCDCPATGCCQHILAAAISLQREAAAPALDALAPLREALLALPAAELLRHAGKAGYRWAWQYLEDLCEGEALQISGERHLVLSLQRPRLTLRYMGGGLDGLIADVDLAQLSKYRVAAVLAFQRAHGREPVPPEPEAVSDPGSGALEASRQRLREAVRPLLADAVELGLSHLSGGMQARFTTLAVWALGADYPRLALLLRRIADHVELLLQRAGGADEHRLLDELSLAHALVDALGAAAARGRAPVALLGRARTRYDETGTLELLGLGAQAWRSASGYLGLTMLFWSPQQGFMSCTEARPESQRGFDPIARYRAPGPWSGLAAPQQASGQRLALQGAQLNEAMRLSAREATRATLLPPDAQAWSAARLQPWTDWAALAASRGGAGDSLLSRPATMRDWVFLQPARLGPCRFDAARQTLLWPLWDAESQVLPAELAFERCTEHAMARIEALPAGANTEGLMVVARLHRRGAALIAEPLSLIRPGAALPVDALHFDAAPGGAGLQAPRREAWAARDAAPPPLASPLPAALEQTRQALRRHAERGLPGDAMQAWTAEHERLLAATRQAGLSAFAALAAPARAQELLLRMNYLCMEYEALAGSADPALE